MSTNVKLNEGYFYVDENLYYLYPNKITNTLDEIAYQEISFDYDVFIPKELPSNVTSDTTLWATSEYGIFLDSTKLDYFIDEKSHIFINTTSSGPFKIKGLHCEAQTGSGGVLYHQTELDVYSIKERYFIPTPSITSPIVITDDSLYPTEFKIYQQHRFSTREFNDYYTEIVLHKPDNLLPDPDFSLGYSYDGVYTTTSTSGYGLTGIIGTLIFTSESVYVDNTVGISFIYSGILEGIVSIYDINDAAITSYELSLSSASDAIYQLYYSDRYIPFVQTSTSVYSYDHYTGKIGEIVYTKIDISSELLHFAQIVYDDLTLEFNNNSYNIMIEYDTNSGIYDSNVYIDPKYTRNLNGFLAIDGVYKDTVSASYSDFQCDRRQFVPYAKVTGINKYQRIEIDSDFLQVYPQVEYRYKHDDISLGSLNIKHWDMDCGTTSKIYVQSVDVYNNPVEFNSVVCTLSGNPAFGSVLAGTSISDIDGISDFDITFNSFYIDYTSTITVTGTDYFITSAYESVYDNIIVYDDSNFIYQQQDFIEATTSLGISFSAFRVTSAYEISNTNNVVFVELTSTSFPGYDFHVYASDICVTSDFFEFTSNYVILEETFGPEIEAEGTYCLDFDRKGIKVKTNKPYLYIDYTQKFFEPISSGVLISAKAHELITGYLSSPKIAFDLVDRARLADANGSIEDNIIYRNAEVYRAMFTGEY